MLHKERPSSQGRFILPQTRRDNLDRAGTYPWRSNSFISRGPGSDLPPTPPPENPYRLAAWVQTIALVEAVAKPLDKPVGERDCQPVLVQASLGGFDPWLEPVALPHRRLDKHDLGPPARTRRADGDCPASRSCRIVRSPVEICLGTGTSHAPRSRPFENRAIADRGHHRARDDRSDARHRDQPLARRILIGRCFDVGG